MKTALTFSLALALLAGCVTPTTVYSGCYRVYAPELPPGWVAWSCPHPFLVGSYGWRPAMTRLRTQEVFIQEGHEYLLPHEIRHAQGIHPIEWPRGAHTSPALVAQGCPRGAICDPVPQTVSEYRVGEEIQVVLPFTPGTGERWAFSPPKYLEIVAIGELPCDQPEPGCRAAQVFHFIARRPGRENLHFELARANGPVVGVDEVPVRVLPSR